MAGWYDDGSEEEAEMMDRLAQRQREEHRERMELEQQQEQEHQRIHEARMDAAEEMYEALKRFLDYWESDFIKVTAEDGRTLAEQMHMMAASLAKADGRVL